MRKKQRKRMKPRPRRRARSAFAISKDSILMLSAHMKPGGSIQVYIRPEIPPPKQWGVVCGLVALAATELYADQDKAQEEILDGIAETMRAGRTPQRLLVNTGAHSEPLIITLQ